MFPITQLDNFQVYLMVLPNEIPSEFLLRFFSVIFRISLRVSEKTEAAEFFSRAVGEEFFYHRTR